MKNTIARVMLLLACVLPGSYQSTFAKESEANPKNTASEKAGVLTSHQLDRDVKVHPKYLLYLPQEYAAKANWPVVLFLHGAGERGDNLDLVKKHGPPKLIAAGKQFPFIMVAPQCPGGRWWNPSDLDALLDEVVENHKVDQDRVYVTGLSMGGFGTWALGAHSPKRFAALLPICGGGEPITARLIVDTPTWVFHGAKDPVVPLSRSEAMVEAIKKAGGNAKFTVYPDAGHDAWSETYADPKVFEWMLEQKRSAKSESKK